MKSYADSWAEVRETWLDLWYVLLNDLGLIRLMEKLGIELRPWVTKRRPQFPPQDEWSEDLK